MAAKKPQRVPKYRLHKPTGQAFVELQGYRLYLGRYDLPKTRQRYHQVIAEYLAAGRQLPVSPDVITMMELLARFWTWAEGYYAQPDGTPTGEIAALRQAMKPLKELYGHARAVDFGPLALRAVRDRMVSYGWCRNNVNKTINRVRLIFRWATEQQLIPPGILEGLRAVASLKRGRSDARESEPVKPVAEDRIRAIEPHVSRQVWALVQLQLLTAARAGEVVTMRPADLDTGGKVWLYRPAAHKTAHRGHTRTIYLGPRAQRIVRPFLLRPPEAFMFSPVEAESERRARVHDRRQTPAGYGNRRGTNRKARPAVAPGSRYTSDSYNRAVARGCDLAFPPPAPLARVAGETARQWRERLTPEFQADLRAWQKAHRWHTHQLRHTAGTFLRKEFGLETARIILGHRSAAVAEIYAEVDEKKAVEAIARVG